MRTRFLQMALIAGLTMLGVRSSAQVPQTAQAELPGLNGPMIMRMVLTMQANRPFGAAGYGTLSDVLPLIPGIVGDVTMIDEQTASLRGYTIRLTRSIDRRTFELTLTQPGRCATGWFSNEKNVIYASLPLGCSSQ
jgi:hypothetical protein